jgi:hypothetical protein
VHRAATRKEGSVFQPPLVHYPGQRPKSVLFFGNKICAPFDNFCKDASCENNLKKNCISTELLLVVGAAKNLLVVCRISKNLFLPTHFEKLCYYSEQVFVGHEHQSKIKRSKKGSLCRHNASF